jgi:membrane protease YdiL (CAAX protease family)
MSRAFDGTSTIRLWTRSWGVQVLIALTGPLLGLAALQTGLPENPLLGTPGQVVGAGVILGVFGGMLEELLFRGIVQGVLGRVSGNYALISSNLLFVAFYLGSGRVAYVLVVGLAGLYFGWCAKRTRSVVGVAVAHALMNVAMLVGPMVLG